MLITQFHLKKYNGHDAHDASVTYFAIIFENYILKFKWRNLHKHSAKFCQKSISWDVYLRKSYKFNIIISHKISKTLSMRVRPTKL